MMFGLIMAAEVLLLLDNRLLHKCNKIIVYIMSIDYRLLDSDREPIPDVPAVYFIMPTDDNIQRITRVCILSIYTSTNRCRSHLRDANMLFLSELQLGISESFISINYFLQDFQGQLYESYYLNFISAISRQRLEDIAMSAIQQNCVAQVSKVCTHWYPRRKHSLNLFADKCKFIIYCVCRCLISI